jgi:hypothetical protein
MLLKRWVDMVSLDCSTDGARISKEDHSSLTVVRFGSTLHHLLASAGKASLPVKQKEENLGEM